MKDKNTDDIMDEKLEYDLSESEAVSEDETEENEADSEDEIEVESDLKEETEEDSEDETEEDAEDEAVDDIEAGSEGDSEEASEDGVIDEMENESADAPQKKARLYEDYIIDDPEDMDEAPDTGDMFDDDDDIDIPNKRRRNSRKAYRAYGPSGKLLAMLWVVFVVMLCGYVYVFHINTTIFAEDITGRDNSVNIEVPAGANYSLCNIDEINQLVSNYLLARTNADQTTLKRLVTAPSEFDDMTSIEIAAQYITAYNRTTCYMVPGKTADAYIIYALSNLTIKDVNSEPLDIRSFYIVKQTDGSYKIDNSQLSDDVNVYIQEVTASKYIQDMYQYVKENTDYLLNNDETFKKFQNMYN